ncbi:sugar ABC transporter permease [Skermanella aerolata]|jgi:ribose transport system permease protein|uniref:Sugar ABC transporter permease n=1 Tax=Skermanella aerolata TaxID=393310 RepID=A0A512DMV7_9PROT|nr:ABC transporter permease [Skermanella aerolata]KJB96337.1 RbsC [Skermanella aerolata KACC 11604]GEO37500.1 sugar ABC transporter permease [Skermanella aerolata]
MNTVRLRLALLRNAPVALFVVVLAVFGSLSDRFLDVQNFTNILIQASHIAILGIGMTFVLLTAGIDLSVGAVMYLSVALLGIYLADASPILAVPAMMAVGALFGLVNAFFVVRLRVAAFIVTLATLFIGRGLALWVTETRMVFYKDQILSLARAEFLGVPWAIWVFAIVFAVAWIVLNHTPFGRQVYAVGENPDAAAKAGINVPLVLTTVYAVSGACAGIAGFVSITQVGAAASSFAMEKEFAAVAASVLGGVSLFGGRGGVAGTVFGAVLIQTVQNGLVIVNADPYIYPLVTSSIIFVAVFVDSQRSRILERLGRRRIRIEERPV